MGIHRCRRFLGAFAVTTGLLLSLAPVASASAAVKPAPSTWKVVKPAPLPRPEGGFTAVSCPSASFCMAVGYEAGTGPGTTDPIAETFTGHTWHRLHPINRANQDVELLAVSCATATSCTAIGDTVTTRQEAVVAERWNGRTWRLEPFSHPTRIVLNAVACPTPSWCTAVGSEVPGSHRGHDWDETWHAGGTGWQGAPLPETVGIADLQSVACPTASFCLAAGGQSIGEGVSYVAARWNGSSWTRVGLPSTADGMALSAISCAAAAFCGALGTHGNTEDAVMLQEGAWTVHPIPSIGAAIPDMTAISCPVTPYCYAVGHHNVPKSSLPEATAASEAWEGSIWRPLITPDPNPKGEVGSSLNGVSCASARYCVAVGGRELTSTGDSFPTSEVGGVATRNGTLTRSLF
jgi:hypothetical protein